VRSPVQSMPTASQPDPAEVAALAAARARVLGRIEAAARRVGRDPAGVRLVAVSKTVPPERLRAAVAAGLDTLGENRVQEALAKLDEVPGATWHLVGPLQANKARRAVAAFAMIETVDSLALAGRLDRLAAELRPGRPLPVLLEVNVDADPAKAEVLKKGVRVYPWSQRENPPATRYLTPDPDKLAKMRPMPRGMEYWERLAAVIEHEPVEDRDRFFVAMLRPLGIQRGKRFKPDERQTNILTEAAFVGEAMAKAFAFNKRFDGARYRPDAHWERLMFMDPAQDLADYSQLDERAAFTYEAIAMSKAMVTKTPGVGQAYLASYHDKEGHAFHGAKSYRLHVPPNPPAKQFWSVTLYDVDTRAIIQNKEQIADRSSRQPDLVKNPDGSVDLYFGPAMPKGPSALLRIGLEKNWIPTVPGKAWFAYFRFYAPLEAYFDTTWPLPDIERVQ